MKRQALLPALTLALVCSLSACRPAEIPGPDPTSSPTPSPTPSPVVTATPTPTPVPTPPAGADPVWGEQVFTRVFQAGDGAEVLNVTYTLPLVQNTAEFPAGAAINTWYQGEGASRLADAEENYETAVADYDVSSASGLPFQPTREEMTFRIIRQDAVISVARDYYVNSGGAYPMVFRFSEQFDGQTGKQLGFADFFSDPDAALRRVEQALLAQSDVAQAIRSGALTEGQVTLALQPEHFYLTGEGYVFWLQAGDLPALHSYIEVTLPYDAVKDVSPYGG